MSSKNLVICDCDVDYVSKLAAFFNGKKELAFQVKINNSPEQVQEILKNHTVDILLINENFLKECSLEEYKGELIVLSEMRDHLSDNKWNSIFKYQTGEVILAQVLEFCSTTDIEDIWRVRKRKRGICIGLYSPVRRLGQTSYAFEKCRELSEEENVLYLNMETFSGFGDKETQKNMSTLLYYAKQEAGNLGLILTTLICRKDGVDYIPPVLRSEDLRTVTKEEWLWLFQKILRDSIYDVLVLDLGESIQGLYDILQYCDTVYMPVADDEVAASKIEQYENNLREMGYGDVVERMIRCDIRRTVTRKNFGKTRSVKRS